MNIVDIEAGLLFSTTTLRSDHVLPHVKSFDVKYNIDKVCDIIKLRGNLVTDLNTAAEVLFTETIAAIIEKTIVVTLKKGTLSSITIFFTALMATSLLVFLYFFVD